MKRMRCGWFLPVILLLWPVAASAQWESPSRAFHKSTTFPLEGRHLTVPCESCHIKGVMKGTPTTCYACHWIRRQDDLYRTRLGTQCEQCHSPIAWTNVRWDHASATGTPLNAAHRTLSCDSCHKNAVFKGGNLECVSCHREDYDRTRSPNHAAAGFPTTCDSCHKPSDATFTQARFDHNASFPLVGTHATQTCSACHVTGVFKGTARDCVGCHRADYQRAQSPNHVASGFPTTCESCHRPSAPSWRSGSFNHNSVFPLVGLHATQTCAACHKNNVYKGTPRDCVGCHRTDYDRAANPNHIASGFSTACESCHKPTDGSWRGANFNHNSVFPLVGLHASQSCAVCHKNGVYKGTPRDCVGCHRADYDRAANPNHVASGFSTACESCHKPTDGSWRGANFNHNTVFPLVGLHASQSCAVCHKNGVYKGTPRDCVGCHRDDYNQTKNPNHTLSGFSTSCNQCHKATDGSWRGGSFNHSSVFPLVGPHASQSCVACHKNGVYKGTPRACVGCHQADYNQTKNPNHTLAGFSTSCDQCHKATDASWGGANFNHNNFFPLIGRHSAQSCAACHKNGVYKGAPRACVGCHQTDYNQTKNPNHTTAGFSTSCDQCHKASDSSWLGANFNHNNFFALKGVHATQACAACHKNSVYKGTPRNCYPCHTSDYNGTSNPNHRAAGFPTSCDSCHNAGDPNWLRGRFTHTQFPISSGRHSGNPCSACHTSSGNYRVFTCTTCHGRSETDRHHQGEVSGYRYDSNACYACHPDGRAED